MIQYSAMAIFNRENVVLWVGDLITVVVLTAIGFASHDQLGAQSTRIAATFFPVLLSWLFVAWPSGLLSAEQAVQPRSLLRAAWAMILAGVLATILRGFMLNRPVPPIFAAVLAGSAVIAILAWRSIFLLLKRLLK
jgi:hypothetical protein